MQQMQQQTVLLDKVLEAIALGPIPASDASTSELPLPKAAAQPLSPSLDEPLAVESTLNCSDNTWIYQLSGENSTAQFFYDYHYHSLGTSSSKWNCDTRQLRNRAKSTVSCMLRAAQVNEIRLKDGTLCTEFLAGRKPGRASTAFSVWDARLKETAGLLTKAVLEELNRRLPVSRARKDTVGVLGQAIDKCNGMWQTSTHTPPATLLSMLAAPPAAPPPAPAPAHAAVPVAAPRQAAPVTTQRSISNFFGIGR